MPPGIATYTIQKSGSDLSANEDFVDWHQNENRTLLALSDGATEAAFSRSWARHLVASFLNKPDEAFSDWTQWLSDARAAWSPIRSDEKVPWYLEEKMLEGAFATFVGVELDHTCRWRAIAIGDSCLISTDKTGTVRSWPVADAASFGDTPMLIGSLDALEEPMVLTNEGDLGAEAVLCLATDALAATLLERPTLLVEIEEAFPETIRRLVTSGEMKNDDATLLVVRP